MGKMEGFLPEKVRNARLHGDRAALSAMGRKGGERAAQTRSLIEAEKERRLQEAETEQAKLYSLSPDGDVEPPDPKILESQEES